MSQNHIDPSSEPQTKPESSSFLGGGPKFNQAGLNTPMPGEKTADAAPAPLFGGIRLWAGVLAIIVLVAVLWFTVGSGISGTAQRGNSYAGKDITDAPDVNSDAPNR